MKITAQYTEDSKYTEEVWQPMCRHCLCKKMTCLCQVHQGVGLIIQFPLLHLHTAQSDLGQGEGQAGKRETGRGEKRERKQQEKGEISSWQKGSSETGSLGSEGSKEANREGRRGEEQHMFYLSFYLSLTALKRKTCLATKFYKSVHTYTVYIYIYSIERCAYKQAFLVLINIEPTKPCRITEA